MTRDVSNLLHPRTLLASNSCNATLVPLEAQKAQSNKPPRHLNFRLKIRDVENPIFEPLIFDITQLGFFSNRQIIAPVRAVAPPC